MPLPLLVLLLTLLPLQVLLAQPPLVVLLTLLPLQMLPAQPLLVVLTRVRGTDSISSTLQIRLQRWFTMRRPMMVTTAQTTTTTMPAMLAMLSMLLTTLARTMLAAPSASLRLRSGTDAGVETGMHRSPPGLNRGFQRASGGGNVNESEIKRRPRRRRRFRLASRRCRQRCEHIWIMR